MSDTPPSDRPLAEQILINACVSRHQHVAECDRRLAEAETTISRETQRKIQLEAEILELTTELGHFTNRMVGS